MNVSILPSDQDTSAWDQYVLDHPRATGYHLAAWRTVVREAFGHPTTYLIAEDSDGSIRGVLPLVLLSSMMFGRFLVSLPFVNYGGILADHAEAEEALKEAAICQARASGATHVELRHQEADDIGWSSTQRKVSMRLNLPGQFDELWKAFPSKLRSQIRRAEKEGMTVKFGWKDCVDEFYQVFSRCMRDLGTPVYARTFFDVILKAFPNEARICVVSLNGVPLAAAFLYGFRRVLEIPWAASDRRFNRLAPNMLLYRSALEYACQHGFRLFDFGRSTPNSGPYQFKQQWGAKPSLLHWYYWVRDGDGLPQLNPQNPKYGLAIKVWRNLPVALTNLVGPHLVKYLP
jgi:serine/alanine adding enzyme